MRVIEVRTVECDVCGKEWEVSIPPPPDTHPKYLNGTNEVWLCPGHVDDIFPKLGIKDEGPGTYDETGKIG